MNGQVPQLSSIGFEQLASASDELLSACDIAVLNLLCAKGLPGTQGDCTLSHYPNRTFSR